MENVILFDLRLSIIIFIQLFIISCTLFNDKTTASGSNSDQRAEYFDVSRSPVCPEPAYCECNWKQKSVTCGNNITFIPELPSITRNLSMDHSYLENVDRGSFVNLTNVRLNYLGLTHCGLKTLSEDALQGVAFLKYTTVSISGNPIPLNDLRKVVCHISSANITRLRLEQMSLKAVGLPSGVFECLSNTSITHLSLKNNGLVTFSGNVFSSASKLQSLQLDYNVINSVELINMKSLKYLGMRWNSLVKIPTFTDSQGKSLCPKINTLALSYNTGLKDPRPSDFRGLKSLVDLQLRSNNIRILRNNLLSEMPKLQKIQLKNNLIREVFKDALKSKSLMFIDLSSNAFRFYLLKNSEIFRGCPNVISLYLTDNSLKRVTDNQFVKLFSPLLKLEKLHLDNTRLKKIPYRLFESLPSLQNLVMSTNSISQWTSLSFVGAKRLKNLYLANNQITLVNKTSFPNDLLVHLEKLYLGQNPFACTCDLMWFRNWVNQTNITIGELQDPYAYKCNFPQETKGKPLLQYRPTIKECTAINMYILVGASLGGFVAMVTIITVIAVRYRMHIRYFFFLLRSRMKQYTKLDDVNNYCYDAFVLYSSDDREWVLQQLLPRVEYQEGLKLSVYDRDFLPGRDIVDNIMEHLESSRMVIVVLSDNFAKSEWCKWELTMAQNKLLDERKDILILVKLDEIKAEHLTNRLMLLMRDKVYIDWSDCALGQDMFWKRLLSALSRPLAPNA